MMDEGAWVVVKRDIEVITVPYGTKMMLASGTQVRVAQSAGGNYTVMTDLGVLCRVNAEDADAIGETSEAAAEPATDGNAPYDEKRVWAQLRTVFDPEIPINIVDLGLVYEVKAQPRPAGGQRVEIKMTMTAPGCGMGEVLKGDVEQKVARVAGVGEVKVSVVFEPPWSLKMMSEAARLQLGL
jgi:probable FeS assembly SUF system protein SufT